MYVGLHVTERGSASCVRIVHRTLLVRAILALEAVRTSVML